MFLLYNVILPYLELHVEINNIREKMWRPVRSLNVSSIGHPQPTDFCFLSIFMT